MQYIERDKLVHIEWSIFRGTSHVSEDFSRALVKVFLIGTYEKYLLTATAQGGTLVADLPQGLPEGAYSLEAVWVKNYGNLLPKRQTLTPSMTPPCPRRPGPRPNDPCFIHPNDDRFNDRCLMRSRKDYLFALTNYASEATVTDESGEVTVKCSSAVATYGYDGLSAYELAVMRGDFSGSEGEYLEQQKYTLPTATEMKLGGIKAAQKTDKETVEVKIDPESGKLYVPPSEGEVLEVATESKLGGIKASAKTDNETVEAKIGKDGKLYVPKGGEELKTATETTLGGVKAATKTSLETQEVKIDPATGKLYTKPGGEGSVEIVNNPDDEDLHSVEKSEDVHVLQFADKEYNASSFSGLGRVYLRKNISDGKNVLTQAMMNKANTRYIIQYDYDLDGATITMPTGCTLDFQGGSLKNGTIEGNNTRIKAELNHIFATSITTTGSWKIDTVHPAWFGAKGDGTTDDTDSLQKAFDLAVIASGHIYISNGASYYKLSEKIEVNLGTDKSIFIDSDLAELKLDSMPTVSIPSSRSISHTVEYAILYIYSYSSGSGSYNDGNATRANIKNLVLNGTGVPLISDIDDISLSSATINGAYIDASNISVENLKVINCFGTGLRLVGADELTIRNIRMDQVGGRPGTPNHPNNSGYTHDNFGDGIYIGYTSEGAAIELSNINLQSYKTLGYKSRAGIVFEYCQGNYKVSGVNITIDYFAKSFHIEERNANGSLYYFSNVKCTHSNIPFTVTVGSNNYYYLNNFYLECLDNGDGREDQNWFLLYSVTNPIVLVNNSHLYWNYSDNPWCNVYNITFNNCVIDGNSTGVYFTGRATYNNCTFYRVGNNNGIMTFYSGGSSKTRQYLNSCKFENCQRIHPSGVYLYNNNSQPDSTIMDSGGKTKFYVLSTANASLDINIPIQHLTDENLKGIKVSGTFSIYLYIGTPGSPDQNVYRSISGTYILDNNLDRVEVQTPTIYGENFSISITDITITMTKSQMNIKGTINNSTEHSIIVEGIID